MKFISKIHQESIKIKRWPIISYQIEKFLRTCWLIQIHSNSSDWDSFCYSRCSISSDWVACLSKSWTRARLLFLKKNCHKIGNSIKRKYHQCARVFANAVWSSNFFKCLCLIWGEAKENENPIWLKRRNYVVNILSSKQEVLKCLGNPLPFSSPHSPSCRSCSSPSHTLKLGSFLSLFLQNRFEYAKEFKSQTCILQLNPSKRYSSSFYSYSSQCNTRFYGVKWVKGCEELFIIQKEGKVSNSNLFRIDERWDEDGWAI